MRRLMRKHRSRHNIANRKYVRHIGSHLFIDLDDAALANIHARIFCIQLITIGATTDSDQHSIVYAYFRRFLALERHFDSRDRWAHADDFG